jgi:hypothetical protein
MISPFRACLIVAVAFLIIFGTYLGILFNLEWPMGPFLSFFLAILMLFSLTILRTVFDKFPELRLLGVPSANRKSGQLTAVAGTILPESKLLVAPYSGTQCTYYNWEIWRYEKWEGKRTRKRLAGGIEMVPAFVRSDSGDVKLSGKLILFGFPTVKKKSLPLPGNLVSHWTDKSNDLLDVLANVPEFKPGEFVHKYRTVDAPDLKPGDKFEEECLPVGEKVVAIGYWSEASQSLLGESRGTRGEQIWIHRGDIRQAKARLGMTIAFHALGGLLLGLAVNICVWLLWRSTL